VQGIKPVKKIRWPKSLPKTYALGKKNPLAKDSTD